jgi:hypothetical protein
MNETFDFVKWLTQQSDRALFLVAIAVSTFLTVRNMRRSENQTDQLVREMKDERTQHNERMNDMQSKVFENCESVAQVVATNTEAMKETKSVLEQVKARLSATMFLALLALTASGCMKRTEVEHTWLNGEKTRVKDERINMKQEASFEFETTTNGTKRVKAGVKSGGDTEGAKAALRLGMELLDSAK